MGTSEDSCLVGLPHLYTNLTFGIVFLFQLLKIMALFFFPTSPVDPTQTVTPAWFTSLLHYFWVESFMWWMSIFTLPMSMNCSKKLRGKSQEGGLLPARQQQSHKSKHGDSRNQSSFVHGNAIQSRAFCSLIVLSRIVVSVAHSWKQKLASCF